MNDTMFIWSFMIEFNLNTLLMKSEAKIIFYQLKLLKK